MRDVPEVRNLQPKDDVGCCEIPAAVQRMPGREIHALPPVHDRSLQQFGKLHQQLQSFWSARGASRHNERALCSHEQFRNFRNCGSITGRRRRHRKPGNAKAASIFFGDRLFLENRVSHNDRGSHRGRHRNLVGAHGRVRKLPQRDRRIVPFRVVADHRAGILHGMGPLDVASTPRSIRNISNDDVHWDAIGIGVVDCHRRVLQSNSAVRHDHHRPAFDLRVAVGHRNRRLFMAACQQLGSFVAAIINDRLVQRAERRSGVGGDVIEIERLDNVQHEVRTRPIRGIHINARRRRGGFRSGQRGIRKRCYRSSLGSLSGFRFRGSRFAAQSGDAGSGAHCSALKEPATINGTFFGFRHDAKSPLRGAKRKRDSAQPK